MESTVVFTVGFRRDVLESRCGDKGGHVGIVYN